MPGSPGKYDGSGLGVEVVFVVRILLSFCSSLTASPFIAACDDREVTRNRLTIKMDTLKMRFIYGSSIAIL
jgi:hypothetical protein